MDFEPLLLLALQTISRAVPVLVQWLVLGRASIAVIEALVQAWGTLCSDSMWLVRKACAAACPTLLQALSAPMLSASSTTDASIVSAAEATAPETAQLQALQTHIVQDCYLGKLCKDVSQWVRSAAIAQAGPLLTALPASSLQPPSGLYLGHALLEQFAAAAALVGSGSAAAQAASARSFLGVCKQVRCCSLSARQAHACVQMGFVTLAPAAEC